MARRRTVVAILTAALLSTAAAAPATAAAELPDVPATYTDAAGVVHYAFDADALPGAMVVTQRGAVSKSGSCVIEVRGAGTVGSGRTVTVAQEVTYNPATCEVELAVASYPADKTPQVVREQFGPSTSTMEHAEATSSTGPIAARATTWNGFINGFYKDPPGIRVTRTGASHTWSSAGAVTHYNTWDWLSGTDWHRDAYSTGNTSTATNTKATFRNTLFCNPLANTYAYHYRTEFRGYTNGTWDWGWSSDKAGDCASLLSAGYYVETP